MDFSSFSLQWFDFLGLTGVTLILITYFFLQVGSWASTELRYSLINLVGSMLILVSLLFTFNLASFVIEIFWFLISFMGVIRWFRAQKAPSSTDS